MNRHSFNFLFITIKTGKTIKSNILSDYRIILLLCIVPGLLPFNDPHIIGKIKWITGGAIGMKAIDWFDAIMHGFPFLLLLWWLIRKIIPQTKP